MAVFRNRKPAGSVWLNLLVHHWAGFGSDFVRLIWLVARLNLNGKCYGRCFINLTTFCCISQLFLVKHVNFCSENRITLKDCVPITCNNQFFVNFELNWWKEVSDGHFELMYHPPVSSVKFHPDGVPYQPLQAQNDIRFTKPFQRDWALAIWCCRIKIQYSVTWGVGHAHSLFCAQM